jgi:hypothetical protein
MQYLGENLVSFFETAFPVKENISSSHAEIFDLSIVTEELVRKHRQKYSNERLG